jgi:PhzF family phenazine biosynthesis protein
MKTYFVDSFTNQKFKGNPAAVCILENYLESETMQNIATEIGFSETAFIKYISGNNYSIRFYTPKTEIALCGHATLAASKIIFETSSLESVNFINCENIELKIEEADGKIVMQFPVYETTELFVPEPVFNALGIDKALDTRFSSKNKIILIEISDTKKLMALKPDFVALLNSYSGINGVLVTAKSNDTDFDFHYRYFWPWAGTNEDPVTGGVQTFLQSTGRENLAKQNLKHFSPLHEQG